MHIGVYYGLLGWPKYYVMICIQGFFNGGFHASDSVPGPWLTFLYPVRVTLRYYFTWQWMLYNCRIKLHHSWYQSFVHSLAWYGDSWPCWLPKMNCVVDISNWLFSPRIVMTFRHVWPLRKNTAGIRVLFAGIGWETSTERSTTQPSSYRVPAPSGRLPMQAETSSFAVS